MLFNVFHLRLELVLCLCLISPCGWGIVLISAYCLCLSVADFGFNTLDFDISLLYLVSNAETDDYELVLCSCTVTTSLLLHRVFPEFCHKNMLCVAGCCHHDIAANLQVKIAANLHYVCQGTKTSCNLKFYLRKIKQT